MEVFVPPDRTARELFECRYSYEPLPEERSIRVLVLSPGKPGDDLHATLETSSFDGAKYRAISYTWGDPVFPRTLHLPQGSLTITRSLFGALERFRKTSKPVRLWADAVCIDQSSLEERNHQVQMIHSIFGNAEEVLIWLGEETEADALGIWMTRFLTDFYHKRLGNQAYTEGEVGRDLLDSFVSGISGFESYSTNDSHAPSSPSRCITLTHALVALAGILQKPWFSRLWVVQEVAASTSSEFFCGALHFRYYHLYYALRALLHVSDIFRPSMLVYDGGKGYPAVRRSTLVFDRIEKFRMRPTEDGESLLSTLFHTCDLNASQAHDRLYAIRALAAIEKVQDLCPDYALAVDELWRKIAVFVLTNNNPRRADTTNYILPPCPSVILALGALQRNTKPSCMPSWVPDFANLDAECRRKYNFYDCASRRGNGVYSAISPSSFHIGTLSAYGLFATRVNTILNSSQYRSPTYGRYPTSTSMDWETERLTTLLLWYIKCYDYAKHIRPSLAHNLREPWDVAEKGYFHSNRGLATLLQHGRHIFIHVDDSVLSALDHARDLLSQALLEFSGSSDIDPTEISQDLRAFLITDHGDLYLDSTRVLASTTDGKLCWVSENSQPGDEIWYLKEASFPFVLRRTQDGLYIVVGDAYLRSEGQYEPRRQYERIGLT